MVFCCGGVMETLRGFTGQGRPYSLPSIVCILVDLCVGERGEFVWCGPIWQWPHMAVWGFLVNLLHDFLIFVVCYSLLPSYMGVCWVYFIMVCPLSSLCSSRVFCWGLVEVGLPICIWLLRPFGVVFAWRCRGFLWVIIFRGMDAVFHHSSLHAKAMEHLNNFLSREGTSSLKDLPKIKKVNGCLERIQDHPMLVIQVGSVVSDINYLRNHALIHKFMGLLLSFPVLESWAQGIWNPKGDMEIMITAKNYFLVVFSSTWVIEMRLLIELLIFIIKLVYSSNLNI